MPGDPVHGKGVRPRNGSCAERGKCAPDELTVASLTLNESTATCQKWRGELSKLGPSCGKMAAQALLPGLGRRRVLRSEEHTSELLSLMRISYAVSCLKKKKI